MFQLSTLKTRRIEIGTWVAKLVLLCGGIVSTILWFKVAILPYIFDLIRTSIIPSLRCWFTPPYIYIIFNLIILAILVSSTYRHEKYHPKKINKPTSNSKPTFHIDPQEEYWSNDGPAITKSQHNSTIHSQYILEGIIQQNHEDQEDSPTWDDSSSLCDPCLKDSCKRKELEEIFVKDKVNPQEESDQGTRVNETLEDAWNFIMEGQRNATKRELKKSDTWEASPQVLLPKSNGHSLCGDNGEEDDGQSTRGRLELVRKSDNFDERASLRSWEKFRSPDDLNKRAEAFIKKFTYEMRLQRQEFPKHHCPND
ncbi:hypothetical protein Tsubulata_012381 [Turnera subulata]|uniref:DUF4408 domain-containing protein n=1 Tax=Turnera subulata TaxID=218843 RepID=A0A9Q0FVJ6_9ROSI|nr:hypothetical protein Tsubulata_012381 [Turnera subulata]